MSSLLKDDDLEVVTGCAAAHPNQRGGQHVAMACGAILMIHKPTGVAIRVESERSQIKNMQSARAVLRELVAVFEDFVVADKSHDRSCLVCGRYLHPGEWACVSGHPAPEHLGK